MSKDYFKYVLRQTPADQKRLFEAICLISAWTLSRLDIKKMKGFDGVYRARMGKFRIVFAQDESGEGAIIDINMRGDIYWFK